MRCGVDGETGAHQCEAHELGVVFKVLILAAARQDQALDIACVSLVVKPAVEEGDPWLERRDVLAKIERADLDRRAEERAHEVQVLRADGHTARVKAAWDVGRVHVRGDARAHTDKREFGEGARAVVRKGGERRGESEHSAHLGRVEDEGAEVRRELEELREDEVHVAQRLREDVVGLLHLSGSALRKVMPCSEECDAKDLRRVALPTVYRLHEQLERVQQRVHTTRGARE